MKNILINLLIRKVFIVYKWGFMGLLYEFRIWHKTGRIK